MNLTEKFLQLAAVGSEWILWLLVILSVISVTVMFERWLFYRGIRGKDTALLRTLHEALVDKEFDKAERLVKVATGPGGRIAAAMLDNRTRGAKAMISIMAAMRPTEKLRLERNLSFLGTVGANGPFIGLLGTVLGIITTFRMLEAGGTMGTAEYSKAVMGGIYEALVATAVGLLVAIPAVIAYNYFQRLVKLLLSEADGLTNMIHALLVEDRKE
ncbi:MAG: MotA/TolQ/ExbB proton channel family protein [Myxococcales bacterium]|nr:MotA/TolQ/ExbB proton channel family protein [Myxococcales bacterium]MCB9567426.1 MotA/TolQ/ExbB proton channel family protein [Myxococcales bacterium]MCB9700703.1 MotA/TolQ/ExbB proton channel family protein [Myxococcales bacterium]